MRNLSGYVFLAGLALGVNVMRQTLTFDNMISHNEYNKAVISKEEKNRELQMLGEIAGCGGLFLLATYRRAKEIEYEAGKI